MTIIIMEVAGLVLAGDVPATRTMFWGRIGPRVFPGSDSDIRYLGSTKWVEEKRRVTSHSSMCGGAGSGRLFFAKYDGGLMEMRR